MANSVIGALRVNLGIDTAAFSNGLKNAQSGLKKFGKFAKTGLLAAGAAATAAAGAMAVAVKGTINAADDMAKASRSFGVPIEELSRLKYAADLSGVSFGSLGNALRTLNKNVYDTSKGTGAAKDAFAELGISVQNADGSLKGSTQIMGEVADALQGIDDETRKAAISGKIFGERYGPQLASLLAGGSEGINKLTSEASQFSQVFTEEMGASAEAFNDNMARLKGSFGSIAAEITQRVLPYLEQFSHWLVENAPAIADFVVRMVEMGAAFIQWGQEVGAAVNGVINRIVELDRAVMDWARRFDAAALELLEAFKAIPGQMYQIGADIMSGLWNGIKSKWEGVKSSITGIASDVAERFRSALGIHSPSRVMAEIGTYAMQGLEQGMQSMRGNVEGLAGDITSAMTNAFKGVITGTQDVKDALKGLLSQLASVFADRAFQMLFSGGAGGGGGFFGGLFGGIGKLFGFANGGQFQVGGAGGIDSQVVAFRASPNETVTVTKPGQDFGGGATEVTVRGVFVDDNGVIKAEVTQMGQQAAQAGAALGVRQVQQGLPSMIADAQSRKM
ncbi:phage tail tape measure protein [Nitratireductor basaltis]|uniref:Tail tape measure protein TP901 core region n=1 Tax=Nitratireductor basaltis TaxID=472175 RepID=A0A084UBJ4_9HYPH|nr:phage tail tape measure protein [Nitratireductor basaltis]KFB10330.1 Tail tape measure protein TP901 core region [Nitratireductor basaltis]